MRRLPALLFAAAGVLGLVVLVVPHDSETRPWAVLLTVAVAFATALVLVVRRGVPRLREQHAVVGIGTVLATSAIWSSGGLPNAAEQLYLWVALYAFYVLPRRVALAHTAAIAVAYGLLMAVDPPPAAAWAHMATSLGTIVGAGLLVHALKTRLDATVARLAEAALTDELTGLANRRAFRDGVERELTRARRAARSTALIMLDLDHFKAVNDAHGHSEGDRVLREAGAVLRRAARGGDLPARLGGEELAVLLPETTAAEALLVAERLRVALRTELPGGCVVTASLGIATAPSDAVDLDGLLQAADRAMYEAKRLGRDRVVVAGGPAAAAA